MPKCKDCLKFEECKPYTTPNETFPETDGCTAFKAKEIEFSDRMLMYIPADGNYIEILGHRIDGFDSFEAFCEHLKKYAELEETVNRQKAELKALQMDNEQLATDNFNANMNCEHLQAEIERLEQENFDRSLTIETWKWEAFEEFAERLHCHCQSIINEEWNKKVYPTSWADAYEEFDDVVDNLVKEMAGAESGS